eukprot:TRINITY_DN26424_c0_g1_i2.p2 TRINITY_DN26424_c0_g1~~TRINITY_DN26424_c0_g1_i2.p2  ORF type:complete len:185 (+),score=-31.76 TRINITY_DN26424_c0_g1_i2:304-858(+)
MVQLHYMITLLYRKSYITIHITFNISNLKLTIRQCFKNQCTEFAHLRAAPKYRKLAIWNKKYSTIKFFHFLRTALKRVIVYCIHIILLFYIILQFALWVKQVTKTETSYFYHTFNILKSCNSENTTSLYNHVVLALYKICYIQNYRSQTFLEVQHCYSQIQQTIMQFIKIFAHLFKQRIINDIN